MNDILQKYLNHFYTIYMDDILIYSCIYTEYEEYLCLVLQNLQNAGLHTKVEKCEFFVTET